MSIILDIFNKRYKRHLIAADVSYNQTSTLDVYRYAEPKNGETLPVIILWHGGSWRRGDKALYPYVADYLARQTGAVIVLPNYQHYPAVKYPFFIDEGWQVVEWVNRQIHEYGGNPQTYSVIGNSAGAHTSTSIALGFRKPPHLHVPRKCVSLAGPNSTVTRAYWPILDMTEPDTSRFPVYFAAISETIGDTDFLIVHGRFDRIVSPKQSEKLVEALRERSATVRQLHPFTGHLGLIVGMGSPFARFTMYARQVAQFLNEHKEG